MNKRITNAARGLFRANPVGTRHGLLKRERIYRSDYRTLDEARSDVFDYIERFHNPCMRQRFARQDMRL